MGGVSLKTCVHVAMCGKPWSSGGKSSILGICIASYCDKAMQLSVGSGSSLIFSVLLRSHHNYAYIVRECY